MEIKNIQRDKRIEKRVPLSIRIPKRLSDWLRKNNISPTKLFVEAIEELKAKIKERKR